MKVAIYSRKSKFTGKGESIENQIQMCKDYLLASNTKNYFYEFLIYEDEGFSGGNTNRPEFKKLLRDVKLRKFNLLICYRLDRISRNVADFSSTLEILQRYNVDFISIKEQFDTSTPMGRAMIYIASVFAQLERETIAERVKDNMLELAKCGRWLGGTTPLGYKSISLKYYDDNTSEHSMSKLIINKNESTLIKLIYEKYLQLKSLNSLESYLLANYYKTRNNANFRKSTLKIILTNPVYAKSSNAIFDYLKSKKMLLYGTPDNIHGFLTYNKLKLINLDNGEHGRQFREMSKWIVAVGQHNGIIESKDWLKVQEIYSNNSNKFITSARSHNALLTGIIKCAICGAPMRILHGSLNKKTDKRIFYYACTLKINSKHSRCTNKNVRTDEIDSLVMKSIKNLYRHKEDFIEVMKFKNVYTKEKVLDDEYKNINYLIKQKESQIDTLITRISLEADLTDFVLPKIKDLKRELSELRKLSSNYSSNVDIYKNTITSNNTFIKSVLKNYFIIDNLDFNEQKDLISGVIKNITWNGLTKDLYIKYKI